MRVSNRQMTNIVKSDLFKNAQQLLNAEERVATRKLINKPSDDPIGMGKVLDYRKTLSSIDQYNNNIVSAKSRTEFTDALMVNLHDLLGQAEQIVAEHSNGLDPELRQGVVQEVEGIYDQVLAIANTKFNGAYLFAGHKTDTQPFADDGSYNGDSGQINIIVGEDAQVRINLTGDEVFTGVGVTNGTNVFDDLKALKDALEADPFVASDVSSLADNLAKGVNQIEGAAVSQSITYRLLETTENHLDKFRYSIVDMLSKIEDADLATAIVELQAQETAYEAALATAAKMFNRRSLIDFL
jgi:flagellar hook-associated protein 3 FlgL